MMPTQRLDSTPPIVSLPHEARIVQVIQVPAASPAAPIVSPSRPPLTALLTLAIVSGACFGIVSAALWQNYQLQALEAQNILLQSKLDRFQQCLESLR